MWQHFLHQRFITVVHIKCVWHLNHCAAPSDRPSAAAIKWRGVLYVTVIDILTITNVSYPFAVKRLAIKHRHCRRRRYLPVSGITEPLPVRTVRRETVVHIDQLRAFVCGIQPIENAVATRESRTLRQAGMYHFHAHNFGCAFHLEISERLLTKLRVKFTISSVKHIFRQLKLLFTAIV